MPDQASVRYSLSCNLTYRVLTPTTFIFHIEVARLAAHRNLVETLTVTPNLARATHATPDNRNRYFRVNAQPGPLQVQYQAEVSLAVTRADPATVGETPVGELPLDVLPYLLPSRYVSSDRLAAFAERQFSGFAPGHQRVTAICNWIYDNIDYRRGSSDERTTADESLLMRAGVCRDFSHLGIAFCRALSIPARFVSCYAHGLHPADFHAVFEAYLDGRWWLFDATRQANLDGLVRIGAGRDAAEIAFSSPFGEMEPGAVDVSITRVDGAPETGERTLEAISTDDPLPVETAD